MGSASVAWHVRACLNDTAGEARPEASVTAMARLAKGRIVSRLGEPFQHFVRIRHRLVGVSGLPATAPLAVSSSAQAPVRVIATFIDAQAHPAAKVSAEKEAAFLLRVAREFTVPKFVVVRGSDAEVDNLGTFYDEQNVVAVGDDDIGLLVDAVRDALPEYA